MAENKPKVRVRFAPSPTGFLHIGGLRTALYNYLFAKHEGGDFILRIEDTDRTRFVEGGIENIIRTLNWAGLEYDEGPYLKDGQIEQKGGYGPYIQSERLTIYKKYAAELVKKDRAYYCFCAPERLEEVRHEQMAKKQPTMYDGHCKRLPKQEIERLLSEGKPCVLRLNVPDEGETVFNDLIRGEVRFKNKLIDDQVLLKSDGHPTYHLANVVDDHLMKITHVIRAEEWLSSTPKHVLLYEAFDWALPQFAHLPLLLNSDRSKLSKRQGDVAAEDYARKGYLREALVNFIALLGFNPSASQEIYGMDELIAKFDLTKVNKTGAVFNPEKLDWLNGEYIRQTEEDVFTGMCLPYLESANLILRKGKKIFAAAAKAEIKKEQLAAILNLSKDRLAKLEDIVYESKFFFEDKLDFPAETLLWKGAGTKKTKQIMEASAVFVKKLAKKDFTKEILEEKIIAYIKETKQKNGDVLWPMRVALSGRAKSPGPFEIAAILGKDAVLKRLEDAAEKL
ncbi:MAG: glutamate--tRNA ligase [Patescibacteria group bacterium]